MTTTNRYQFKFADPQLDDAMQLAFQGVFSVQDAILSIANKADLWATIAAGAVTDVSVLSGGKYNSVPKVTAVGGGGSGATFAVTLINGAVDSVSVLSGGAGYTSPPALVISGGQ